MHIINNKVDIQQSTVTCRVPTNTNLSGVRDDRVVSEADGQRLRLQFLLDILRCESLLTVGRSDDRVHPILVDVDVRDVRPADLVQGEQSVAVGLHRLDEAVRRDEDRTGEVNEFEFLQLPRPAPMTRQVL